MTQQETNPTSIIELNYESEQTKTNFETAVTESVDQVFASLGENVKNAVYKYVETKYNIRKEQIPANIEDFTVALESIFGDAAKLVELKIMRTLQGKVGDFIFRSKNKDMLFVEYLAALQKHLDWQFMIAT